MSLLYMSVSASCIVIFTAILRRFFKNILPVELFCGLWWLAMLRALIPFSVESEYSLYNLKMIIMEHLRKSTNYTISELARQAQIRSTIFIVCMILIVIGAVFFIKYFKRIHDNCSQISSSSASLQSDKLMDTAESMISNRRIKVRISDELDSPVSYGFIHPVIIMPKQLSLDNDSKETLRCILLHESIHIKYLHYVWKVVSAIVVCVHWFNPVMWLLYWYMDREMETLCDKKVLQALGEDKKEMYARTLIDMAKWQNQKPVFCNNFVERNILKERIIMIMKLKKTSWVMTLTSFLIFSSAVTAFATTDVCVDLSSKDRNRVEVLQIETVGEEAPFVNRDEEIELELSYEEIEQYISQEEVTRAASKLYLKDFEYKSDTLSPKTIKVTIKRDGYIYEGTLSRSHYEQTTSGKYIGYYCGYVYR